jgi:hypothetical protein
MSRAPYDRHSAATQRPTNGDNDDASQPGRRQSRQPSRALAAAARLDHCAVAQNGKIKRRAIESDKLRRQFGENYSNGYDLAEPSPKRETPPGERGFLSRRPKGQGDLGRPSTGLLSARLVASGLGLVQACFDEWITLAPCRSSISAVGHRETEVSKAAHATMKLPARASTSCPAFSSRTINAPPEMPMDRWAAIYIGKILKGTKPADRQPRLLARIAMTAATSSPLRTFRRRSPN